jgi:hypothetical protein
MERYVFSKSPWFIGAPERTLGKGPGLPVETAYFRLSVTVMGTAKLRAAVSASSRYCLYVNGIPAAHGPCKGDTMQYYCDELDLGSLLREGRNVLACKVVSFPPQEACIWGEGGVYTNMGPLSVIGTASGPCLLFYGELEDAAGKTDLSTGNAPWLVQNDKAVSWLQHPYTMVFCHEEVEGKHIPPQWNSTAETEHGFVPAIKRWTNYAESQYGILPTLPLFRRPIPMLEEKERELITELPVELPEKRHFSFPNEAGKPEPVTLESGGSYYIDLDAGELTTGYVSLETLGGRDAEITLTYAESYGGPFTGGIRGDRLDYRHFALGGFKDIYRPAGEEGTWESYEFFWFKTFRILRLEISTGLSPLTIRPVKYRETGYPLDCKTTILPAGMDPWLPALWDISVRTLRRCMHETYEDCPYYEQMQYSFDTRLQMLFHYYLSGDTRLGRKTIDDFHRSILPEGIIQSRYPTNNPQVIPTFSISWLSMLLDYYDQTADTAILERYRPTAEAIILWFRRKKNAVGSTQGFIENLGYWNFIDWAPEWRETQGSVRAAFHGPSTIQNLMYLYGLKLLEKILDNLGFAELRDYYLAEEKNITDLVLAHCWDEGKGLFKEGPAFDAEYTQHAQIWAVLAGIVSGKKAAALMEKALSEPGLIKCTFPLMFYFFRALEEAGLYEKTASLWEDWKRFLPLHPSTVPETPYDDTRSDCHAWSSLLLYEYPAKILGVFPLEPGWKSIGIKPQGLFLGKAAGRVNTAMGIIELAWEYRDGIFTIRGRLPPAAKAVLILPDSSRHNLGEGEFIRSGNI